MWCRVLVWAVTAAIVAGCGGDPSPRVNALPQPPAGIPEGGSNLGSEVRSREAERRETSLLGVMAALLERGAPARTDAPGAAAGPARSAVELAERLPRSRAAAQVLMSGLEGLDATGVGSLDLGAVLIERRNFTDTFQLGALVEGLGIAAQVREHLPPLVAVAQDGSQDTALPGVPGAGLGAVKGSSRVRAAAQESGEALAAFGIHMTLAPVADLAPDGTFGDEPERVTELTAAAVAGFAQGGVVAAPLHFPGQGSATQDPLRGPAVVGGDAATLLARDVAPFRAPARAIVISNAAYAAWDSVTPATLAPEAHALLRGELGFTGVAIADNVLGAAAATGTSPGDAAVAALVAGNDMVLVRDRAERDQVHRAILAALRRGDLPEERLREAVARVVDLKAEAGVLEGG